MQKFLVAAPRARIEMLKPLLEKDADDHRDVGAMNTFLSALEQALADVPSADRGTAHREGIKAVYRARKHIGDTGALIKPLLEQVALLC